MKAGGRVQEKPGVADVPSATVMVVDDDHEIRHQLAVSLRERGYRALTAGDTREMDHTLRLEHVDVIVLDVMMPGEDGLSACRRLAREGGPAIVLLSALGEEQDRIVGLEIGASHYLAKPCSTREVLATVQAALRASGTEVSEAGRSYTFEGWRLNVDAHELLDPDEVLVSVTDGEFSLLRVLVERPRRVLSRDQMLDAAEGRESETFDRAVDVRISRLRRKLRCDGTIMIRTIRNGGYLFIPHVRRGS